MSQPRLLMHVSPSLLLLVQSGQVVFDQVTPVSVAPARASGEVGSGEVGVGQVGVRPGRGLQVGVDQGGTGTDKIATDQTPVGGKNGHSGEPADPRSPGWRSPDRFRSGRCRAGRSKR